VLYLNFTSAGLSELDHQALHGQVASAAAGRRRQRHLPPAGSLQLVL